jgi:glyoxylase-like metal-dependent hydrolase (beta-lactamase superfamily II)
MFLLHPIPSLRLKSFRLKNLRNRGNVQFGDLRIEIIPDTEFRLDGGAMFGVVPHALWSRIFPPDEHNRIRMNMNCLYIEAGREKIIVETGIGDKWSEKQLKMYGIDRKRKLTDSLKEIAGVRADEITVVTNTHLHFDHAGGNTCREGDQVVPTFPNARYMISKAEYEHAESPHERDRASYMSENWKPLELTGQLQLMPDQFELAAGIRMENVPGHNRSMQCLRVEQNGRTFYSFADLVPTRAHVPFAWVMGYDLYPVETLEAKKRLLTQAFRENWFCFFYHDPQEPVCRLMEEDGRLRPIPARLEN